MTRIKVLRRPTDPLCARVSLGGTQEIGYYCVYRGTKAEALYCIELAMATLKALPELDIEAEYHLEETDEV